jgi:hypothetical protein
MRKTKTTLDECLACLTTTTTTTTSDDRTIKTTEEAHQKAKGKSADADALTLSHAFGVRKVTEKEEEEVLVAVGDVDILIPLSILIFIILMPCHLRGAGSCFWGSLWKAFLGNCLLGEADLEKEEDKILGVLFSFLFTLLLQAKRASE